MSDMKEEALKLAKYLYRLNGYMDMPTTVLDITHPAAEMIEKLVAELEKEKAKSVNSANSDFNNCFTKTASKSLSQTKPLSDADICWLWVMCEKDGTQATYVNFARAIEEKLGVK